MNEPRDICLILYVAVLVIGIVAWDLEIRINELRKRLKGLEDVTNDKRRTESKS
jgi:hypothetical protein